MIINIRQVASSDVPIMLNKALDVSHVIKGRKDINGITPLQVGLKAKPAEDGAITVSGTLSCELHMNCSRCLKPLDHKLVTEFEESFKQGDNPEADLQEEDDDTEVHFVPEERIDLVPYIEESLFLSLPFAAVCKEDCKGLCPQCGTDLNERKCDCNTDVIDPRLASLGDFFKNK